MNIEKLTKHLKEFTLDEINMIAECDCETELEQLLNSNKIHFEQGFYKYKENKAINTFEILTIPEVKNRKNILFKEIVNLYMSERTLAKGTLIGYNSLLKYSILPKFGNEKVKNITPEMILEFATYMKLRYKAKTAKNGVSLLGSLLKFAFLNGYINHNPYYGINSIYKHLN